MGNTQRCHCVPGDCAECIRIFDDYHNWNVNVNSNTSTDDDNTSTVAAIAVPSSVISGILLTVAGYLMRKRQLQRQRHLLDTHNIVPVPLPPPTAPWLLPGGHHQPNLYINEMKSDDSRMGQIPGQMLSS